jgi:hypothetical protein
MMLVFWVLLLVVLWVLLRGMLLRGLLLLLLLLWWLLLLRISGRRHDTNLAAKRAQMNVNRTAQSGYVEDAGATMSSSAIDRILRPGRDGNSGVGRQTG